MLEGGPQFTPEEMMKMNITRAESDKELAEGGAEVTLDNAGRTENVNPTDEQIDTARTEMEHDLTFKPLDAIWKKLSELRYHLGTRNEVEAEEYQTFRTYFENGRTDLAQKALRNFEEAVDREYSIHLRLLNEKKEEIDSISHNVAY